MNIRRFSSKLISGFLVMSICLMQSGCATIISGKKQKVAIRSNPSEANVEIDGVQRGKTPLTLELERNKRHQIILTKEGYIEEQRRTKRGFNWWHMFSAFATIVGVIIDFVSGAVYSIKPKEIEVTLTKKENEKPPPPINQ